MVARLDPWSTDRDACPRQTLVTCLYDLRRREGIGRPIEFYWEHGGYVLGLDQPLVVFTEPELAEPIAAARAPAGHAALPKVISRPIERLELADRLLLLSSLPTFENNDATRGTAMHRLVTWSKFEFLQETIHRN